MQELNTLNAQQLLEKAEQLVVETHYKEVLTICQQICCFFEQEKQWDSYVRALNLQSNCLCRNGNNNEALVAAQKSLDIALTHLTETHPETANSYFNIAGCCYFVTSNFDKSLAYLDKVLAIRTQLFGEQHPDTVSVYYNIGMCQERKGAINEALACQQKVLDMRLQTFGKMQRCTADSYLLISNIYKIKGDFNFTIEYAQKALHIYLKTVGENHPNTAEAYDKLGSCYNAIGNNLLALSYHQKALAIRLSISGEIHSSVATSYNNISIVYASLKDTLNQIAYQQKSLDIRLEIFGETHLLIAINYNNLGTCYGNQGNYPLAIAYYQKALPILLQTTGKYSTTTAQLYSNLANHLGKSANYEQAFRHYQLALQSVCPTFNDTHFNQTSLLQSCISLHVLFKILNKKAQTQYQYYKNKSHQIADLSACLQTYLLTNEVATLIRQSYQAEDSKLSLGNTVKQAYQHALLALYEVTQLCGKNTVPKQIDVVLQGKSAEEMIWHFIEKSKAIVLLSNLKDAEAKVLGKIPAQLLQIEENIKAQLNYLNKTITDQEAKPPEQQNTELLFDCKEKQFDYNEQWRQLTAQLEKDYPDYYQLKHQTNLSSIAELRGTLSPQTALLNYFVGDDYVYVATLTTTQLYVKQIVKPSNFEVLCTDAIGYTKSNRQNYFDAGLKLYQLLVAPLIEQLAPPITHLLVLPDAKLSEVPFEALLTDAVSHTKSFANQPYLLHQYSISYHYSASLWQYSKRRAQQKHTNIAQNQPSFVGFAPVYANRPLNIPQPNNQWQLSPNNNHFPKPSNAPSIEKWVGYKAKEGIVRSVNINGLDFCELVESEKEVLNIAHLFTQKGLIAQSYLHANASKKQFLTQTKGYNYVLVAAHNYFDPQKSDASGIIFSPNETGGDAQLFTINEAYQLNLHAAHLVVLSCCESGRGTHIQGEGTISMNRGLLFAGADNVLHSLFKVPDTETAQLITQLFTALLNNTPNHQALSLAKRNFVLTHPNPNPKLWAGFVLLGD